MSEGLTVGLTADAARVLTDEVKADAAALWSKLLELYERGAHKALGYSSWGAYYETEFGESGNYGYRLLKSAQVMDQLPIGNSQPKTEAVARELVPVLREDPERVEEVWAEVVEEHGPAPTAAEVRDHVAHTAPPKPSDSKPLYRFVTEVRFQHDSLDQASAEAWAQRLVERTSRNAVVCVHRTTRAV